MVLTWARFASTAAQVAKPSRFSVRRFGRSYFCWKQLDVAAKLLAAECMVIWLTVVAAYE